MRINHQAIRMIKGNGPLMAVLFTVGFWAVWGFTSAVFGAADIQNVHNTPKSFSGIAEMVSPAVVNIRTEKTIKGGGVCFAILGRDPLAERNSFANFLINFLAKTPTKSLNKGASVQVSLSIAPDLL